MTALTTEQELLLRAALLRGNTAIDAWRDWRSRTDIEALDSDSQWLLPLLYQNLHAQGVFSDLLVRYRNVYLHNWYKNNLTLKQASSTVSSFHRSSGRVVLLGGAAMALAYYDTVGARPFQRVAVMVRREPDMMDDSVNATSDVVDVRASLFGDHHDDACARRAMQVEWKTMRCHVLDPADQLVDICMRRDRWDPRSRLFWLADAVSVIRRYPNLDWARVAGLTDILQQQRVAEACHELDGRFGLGIPVPA